MSKSPDVQKRKPLVTYPISPKSKVKSVSQKSVVDMPTINFEESNTQLDAEKVSKKVEKYIDESSVSKCSPKKSKTVRDQKRHHITRRAIKKQVFIHIVCGKIGDFVCFFHQMKDILKISEPEDNRKVYDEKAAKNCPSYLIWSIFTRKRELQKVQSLEKKPNNSEGKTLKL